MLSRPGLLELNEALKFLTKLWYFFLVSGAVLVTPWSTCINKSSQYVIYTTSVLVPHKDLIMALWSLNAAQNFHYLNVHALCIRILPLTVAETDLFLNIYLLFTIVCVQLYTLHHLMISRGIKSFIYSPLTIKREFSRVMNHELTWFLPFYPIARQLPSP